MGREKARLYIFYGTACAGKSTLALRFAHEHSIRTIVSTDSLREVQRACLQPTEGHPLRKVSHTAWQLCGELSAEHTVRGFLYHVDAVAPALVAVAQKLARDGFDAIIEGVHCYNRVLDQFTAIPGFIVLPRLLAVASEARLREQIQRKEAERSQAAESKAWQHHLPILMQIQTFLLHDARQRNIPILWSEEGGRSDDR